MRGYPISQSLGHGQCVAAEESEAAAAGVDAGFHDSRAGDQADLEDPLEVTPGPASGRHRRRCGGSPDLSHGVNTEESSAHRDLPAGQQPRQGSVHGFLVEGGVDLPALEGKRDQPLPGQPRRRAVVQKSDRHDSVLAVEAQAREERRTLGQGPSAVRRIIDQDRNGALRGGPCQAPRLGREQVGARPNRAHQHRAAAPAEAGGEQGGEVAAGGSQTDDRQHAAGRRAGRDLGRQPVQVDRTLVEVSEAAGEPHDGFPQAPIRGRSQRPGEPTGAQLRPAWMRAHHAVGEPVQEAGQHRLRRHHSTPAGPEAPQAQTCPASGPDGGCAGSSRSPQVAEPGSHVSQGKDVSVQVILEHLVQG